MQSTLALIITVMCCVGLFFHEAVETAFIGLFFFGVFLVCSSIEKLGEKK